MSTKQRADAEALRAKYARVFGVPKVYVEVELTEDEDALVFANRAGWPNLPTWTLGSTDGGRDG